MAILRPSSDLITGGWTSSPSGTLASCIDETTASDSDYIETTGTGNSSIILLGSGSDPGNDNNHQLRYRASSTSETLNVDVVQMAPTIVTRSIAKPIYTGAVQSSYMGTDSGTTITLSAVLLAGSCATVSWRYEVGSTTASVSDSLGNNWKVLGQWVGPSSVVCGCAVCYPVMFSGSSTVTVTLGASKSYRSIQHVPIFNVNTVEINPIVKSGASNLVVPYKSKYINSLAYGLCVSYNANTVTIPKHEIDFGAISSYHRCIGVLSRSSSGLASIVSSGVNTILVAIVFSHSSSRKKVSYFDAPNVIATRTPSLTSSPSDQTIDLTSGEAANITDYSKLGLRFRT